MNLRAIMLIAVAIAPAIVYATVAYVPYCAINSGSTHVYPGSQVRLVWYTANASHASINGIGPVSVGQGYYDVYPTHDTVYTMTAANETGSRTCSVLITTVKSSPNYPPVAAPTVSYPATIINTMLPVTRNYTQTPPYDAYEIYYVDRNYGSYTSDPYDAYASPYYTQPYIYDAPCCSTGTWQLRPPEDAWVISEY